MTEAHAEIIDQFTYWRSALAGNPREDLIERGKPHSGFYRDRSSRAVAIWRDAEGNLLCRVTSGFQPRHDDEIDELFGWICHAPITRELFIAIRDGSQWPEEIPDRGIGDNAPPADLPPDQALLADIRALETQCREWLKSLPEGKPQTKVEADRCANYAVKFGDMEKKATELHKAEKQPFLDAGRECDAKWFRPVRDVAAELKTKIKAIANQWLAKENSRLEEEARKANEEARRAAEEAHRQAMVEADRAGDAPPPKPIIEEIAPQRAIIGTKGRVSQRKRHVAIVTDAKALLAYFAAMPEPPADLIEEARKTAERMMKAGVGKIDGVELEEQTYAA